MIHRGFFVGGIEHILPKETPITEAEVQGGESDWAVYPGIRFTLVILRVD